MRKAGPWDNKSYKDMYHFNDHFYPDTTIEDMPSLNVDPKINSTISDNPYRSNVEIEKDEVILQPDLSALFMAKGKTHKNGGIDVSLRPESFVFSDDKTLAFGEKDHKLFEFKKGGSYNPEKNTPADVLKRNIDVKHYNRLVANITDMKKDDLAKKSSVLMLEKYIKTLGNIAYLQEAKKDFPQGLPAFSENTAPIYNADVKDKVMEQKQYAKYGGTINPYMLPGGVVPCPCGKGPDGKCLPCDDATYQSIIPKARKVKEALPGYDPLYTSPTGTQLFGKFGENPAAPGKGSPAFNKAFASAKKQGLGTFTWNGKSYNTNVYKPGSTTDDYIAIDPITGEFKENPPVNIPHSWDDVPDDLPQKPQIKPLTPNTPVGAQDRGRDINWTFSPWQRISQAYNLSKLASVKKYVPYRSHLNPTYVDPALVNPEQVVGDMKGAYNQNLSATNSLSPILRNAQAQSSFGQLLNQIPGVRSQYDNQNIGIINQFRQYNNQIGNNARLQNMQNDQQYYQQSVVANQNFDNMKTFLGDQYMNNLIGDVQDNQTLAYNLATLDNPAYNYDFRTGNYRVNPNRNVLNVRGGARSEDDILQLVEDLKEKGYDSKLIGDIIRSKVYQSSNKAKKGGIIGHNPYK